MLLLLLMLPFVKLRHCLELQLYISKRSQRFLYYTFCVSAERLTAEKYNCCFPVAVAAPAAAPAAPLLMLLLLPQLCCCCCCCNSRKNPWTACNHQYGSIIVAAATVLWLMLLPLLQLQSSLQPMLMLLLRVVFRVADHLLVAAVQSTLHVAAAGIQQLYCSSAAANTAATPPDSLLIRWLDNSNTVAAPIARRKLSFIRSCFNLACVWLSDPVYR